MRADGLEIYRDNQILSADPVMLVRLLLEEVLKSVGEAEEHLANDRIMERSRSITKGVVLLSQLINCINGDESPELATRMRALYAYCQRRLLEAHFRQAGEPLKEVNQLLTNIYEAWVTVQNRSKSSEEAVPAGTPGTPGALGGTAPAADILWI